MTRKKRLTSLGEFEKKVRRLAGGLRRYILDADHRVMIETDLMTWARWWENGDNRQVAVDQVGDLHVSTVFLGLDHNYWGDGLPILFETMVFGADGRALDQMRYSSWDDAETAHKAIVRKLTREAASSS